MKHLVTPVMLVYLQSILKHKKRKKATEWLLFYGLRLIAIIAGCMA
jgi:hypothetical protein